MDILSILSHSALGLAIVSFGATLYHVYRRWVAERHFIAALRYALEQTVAGVPVRQPRCATATVATSPTGFTISQVAKRRVYLLPPSAALPADALSRKYRLIYAAALRNERAGAGFTVINDALQRLTEHERKHIRHTLEHNTEKGRRCYLGAAFRSALQH